MVTLEEALVSVGKGWQLLIRGLYAAKPEQTKVIQVKEKFGGLRFYTDNPTDEYQALVEGAECASLHICEFCGLRGYPARMPHGAWTKTICHECWAKLKEGK